METLLSPDKGLILWTILTFTIMVAVLGKFAWKPLISALQDREDGIRKALEEAERARQAAEQMRQQFEADAAKAQAKAQEMLAQGQADAQKAREQILKDAEEQSRRLADQTRRQLDEEKAKISRELRQEVAGLTVKATEKLLRHTVNAKEQEALVQDFLKDLDKEKV